MKISFGENPERPKPRSWAAAFGFSWIEWLNDDCHILDEAPQANRQYLIRLPANFIASTDEVVTLRWLPADSSINGFDESNIAELARLKFLTGRVSLSNDHEKTIAFYPTAISSPADLILLKSCEVTETDTLTDCQRWEYSFDRFKCVEFSMEGDVNSRYVFLDGQLILLEHSVWGDAHFWIGNGKLTPSLASKVFPGIRQ